MNILLLGAGGPAGANVARSLPMHMIVGTDSNPYHLHLNPYVDQMELVPPNNASSYFSTIQKLIETYRIELIHAQPDSEVQWLSRHRRELSPALSFLPDSETIEICSDKQRSAECWKKHGIKAAESLLIRKNHIKSDLKLAQKLFGTNLWIRATTGAGGRGSTPATIDTAYFWIRYWYSRGFEWEFMAQQNLTGRNIAWSSLWYEGELIVGQGRERLEYIYPYLAPSGITGTPTVAKTINEDVVNTMGIRSVLAIDANPHGIYSVDLKFTKEGDLIPTEINAGRFFTTSYFFTQAGLNMPQIMVQLLEGTLPTRPSTLNPLPEELYWIRHIDCQERLLQL